MEVFMNLEGFIPYDSAAADRYEKKRWWLGMTLGDMFDKASDLYPQKDALVGSGVRYTYAQLRRRVNAMAYRMLRAGFKAGDRLLLQLPNWPQFVIAYFALQKVGLIMVPLTVNHTAREIAHLAELTRPKGWILPEHYRKIDFLSIIRQTMKITANHLKTFEAAKIHYPERTIFVSEIPLTAAGKADKKILKKDIAEKLKAEAQKS
jgi:2,3-dihydroxybenzoate-AMP ligase/mycobactin salicyl-AMP ligase